MRLCSKSLINVWHRTLSDIFASFVASDELVKRPRVIESMHDSVRSCALFLDISAKHNGER
ncbi:hypothetical protein T02_6570 [Trichinella nativa]|uniref:Uncharacterized protein n=2 Tax=Trichinella TaxID=6333 RepID=A0A0V0SUD7_9BILA|nr:hypothetical protein T05_8620 [Trichinella murrelli]KRX31119.1 hypothetical protein T05_1906 [Trichinella murrelli]KRZ47328.1 hypothetical protein T02_6570 [Trichinella nativa]